jgi:ABC-type spermidine/putrescine transport system permease subunit II
MITAPSTPRLTLRLGRFFYLALNVSVVVFLLAPIAIVFVFALNRRPSFRRWCLAALVREILPRAIS